MCGIAGVLLPLGQSVTEAQVRAMGETLFHRGPDNFGLLVRKNIGFAHTRLSILDPSPAAHQPIHDGRYTLIYNGEIYNYLDLRRQLETRNVSFKSTSDTEVLFHYLIHFGVAATLPALRGMFAFSFYDNETDTVYLCRDHLGIKPLFWTRYNGGLYWASEVKALRAMLPIRPDPVKTLFAAASIADHSNEYTVFKDVYHVPPGAYLVAQSALPPRIRYYYDILDDIHEATYRELNRMTMSEVTERFQQLFRQSVKSMMISDAPLGAFVSGGIDSGLVALHASRQHHEIAFFTANVLGKYSEVEEARFLSRSLGCPLHEAPFAPEMMLQLWAKATFHYEAPLVTHTNAVPFAVVAELARQNSVKAVLTGEGADELFLGYPYLFAKSYRKLLTLPVELLKGAYRLIPKLRLLLFPEGGRSINDFLELLVQTFERQRLRERGFQAYEFLPSKEIPRQYLTIQMLREHLISLLHRNDRMGMLASIESRFPFLDEDLIRFAVNLPYRFKVALTHRWHDIYHPFLLDKAILRQAGRAGLSASLVRKPKRGFPMYGHKFLEVRPGFFKNGYLADLAGLTSQVESYMLARESRYFIGKLASVEVFGRLFAFGDEPEKVTEHVLRYATMDITLS
jgi:asparagine synthase (glutamine-hydrolysing)